MSDEKKEKIIPFNPNLHQEGRKMGNTTRQIDIAIQMLFGGHIVLAKDGAYQGDNRKMNMDLFKKILDRLAVEHGLDTREGVRAEIKTLEIELINL